MTLLASPRWHEHAACTGERRHLFYENGRTGDLNEHHRRQRAAIAVCAGCPVRQQCLNDALKDAPADQAEVRGGLTADQRRDQIRQARTPHMPRGDIRLASGVTGTPRSRVDSAPTLALLDELRSAGHTMAAIAATGGMSLGTLDSFEQRRTMRVSLRTAAAVARAHAELLGVRRGTPPDQEPVGVVA